MERRRGLRQLATCPARAASAPACSGNGGTRVPPVGETPFVGELKCIQADPITRLPFACNDAQANACRNDLEGGATITNVAGGDIDPQRYNAVGLRSAGQNNGDNMLVIGGPPAAAEYQPCSEVLVFNHLFDGAIDPISGDGRGAVGAQPGAVHGELPQQEVPSVTAQFLVYNEFEQRFSTSRLVRCLLDSPISSIDTSQSDRSIFSAAVSRHGGRPDPHHRCRRRSDRLGDLSASRASAAALRAPATT